MRYTNTNNLVSNTVNDDAIFNFNELTRFLKILHKILKQVYIGCFFPKYSIDSEHNQSKCLMRRQLTKSNTKKKEY